MSCAMNSYATHDPAKLAVVLNALQGQNLTAVTGPAMRADGAIQAVTIDMTSTGIMQTAIQAVGMPIATTSGMMATVMSSMR